MSVAKLTRSSFEGESIRLNLAPSDRQLIPLTMLGPANGVIRVPLLVVLVMLVVLVTLVMLVVRCSQ